MYFGDTGHNPGGHEDLSLFLMPGACLYVTFVVSHPQSLLWALLVNNGHYPRLLVTI